MQRLGKMLRTGTKKWTLGMGVIVMVLGLSGCAFKRLIYDRLDWFAMYQIDSYLDLTKPQKLKLAPQVADAIAWVKKEKLPHAIDEIIKLEKAANQHRYDEALVKSVVTEVDNIRVDLINRYEKPITDLFLTLSEDQLKYLEKKMAKSNENLEEVLEEKNPEAEYQDVILKKSLKNLVEWYGELSKPQIDSFHAAMRLSKTDIERRLAERKRLQAYTMETIRSHDPVRMKKLVESMRDSGEVWQDPTYVVYRKASEQRWEGFLQGFHKSLTDTQWTHAEGKLREMRVELEHMIGRS